MPAWTPQHPRTTSQQNFNNQTFRIIHPFHPSRNIEFEVESTRQLAAECRVFYFNAKGLKCSVPYDWTDMAPTDPYVHTSQGRSLFRVEDLLGLVNLIKEIKRVARR